MSYEKLNLLPTAITIDKVEAVVNEIEKQFPKPEKQLNGKTIFVLLPTVVDDATDVTFMNTTVQDLNKLGIDHFYWLCMPFDKAGNLTVMGFRKPHRTEFRDRLKFTPPNAVVGEMFIQCYDLKLGFRTLHNTYALLHKERYIHEQCQMLFEQNAKNQEYETIYNNAFDFLELNKRISKNSTITAPKAIEELKMNYHMGVCAAYDAKNAWGLCYEWNGVRFIFPMNHDSLKNIMKSRNTSGIRKAPIPTIVKKHNRNGKSVQPHYRSTTKPDDGNDYCIGDRHYSIYVGDQYVELMSNSILQREKKYAVSM